MTTTYPDVPLPAGASVVCDWDGDVRLIATKIKDVEGTDTGVSIDAGQLPDGSLVKRPLCRPLVRVDRRCENPQFKWEQCLELSTAGARQLARALLAAADQLDGWDGTSST